MQPEDPVCSSCQIAATRREFIRDASLALAAIAAGFGMSRQAFAEFPVTSVTGVAGAVRAHLYPIPAVDGAQIDRANEVILVRWQGRVYAFNLSCPHQNTALRWDAKAQKFQCPKHHSRYQPDGTFINGRATRGMDRLGLAIEGTNIAVNLDAMHKQDTDPAGWAAAVVHLPG